VKRKISIVDACGIIHAPRHLKAIYTIVAHLTAIGKDGGMPIAWLNQRMNPRYVRARKAMNAEWLKGDQGK